MASKKSKLKGKKRYLTIGIILAALIAVRLMLPHWVKDYLNNMLADSGAYTGHVQDVDLHLYRGAYVIKDLEFKKVEGAENLPPLINAPRIDLSLEWKSLFNGAIVGEIVFDSTNINFVFAEAEAEQQTGAESNWVDIFTQLLPININRLAMNNGDVNFTYKDIETHLYPIDIEVTNIRNVINPDTLLPSSIVLRSGLNPYEAQVSLDGHADFIKEGLPNFDYNASIENVVLKNTQDLMENFTAMDFESGHLNIYSEMAVRQRNVRGYVKPILKEARIFKWKEEDRTLLEGVAEAVTEGVKEVFENKKKNTTGAKVPIEGEIDSTDINYWVAFVSFVRNAFWEALKNELDNSVQYRTKKTNKE